MAKDTRPEDYIGVLKNLSDDGCAYFVEGGQAVNFWAEYFTLREHGIRELRKYQPFTSKDCDLWVSLAALKYFEANADGKLVKGTSPADGQLAVFTTRSKPALRIDLMSGVFGIPPADIGRVLKRVIDVAGIKVLDPLFLFKGKCHNFVKLPQEGRQDSKHLMMLGLILPAYLQELISEVHEGGLDERQLLKEIKLLLEMGKDGWVRQALKKTGLSLDSMMPIKTLHYCGLEKIERFARSTWPIIK
jgi:hypothetical protein